MKTFSVKLLLSCLAAIAIGANPYPMSDQENVASNTTDQANVPLCNGTGMKDPKLNCLGTIFRIIVNIDDLNENCVESTDIVLSGASWKVKFCKGTQVGEDNNANALDLILSSVYGNNTVTWTCEASAAVKLIDKDDQDNNTISMELTKQVFSNTKSSYRLESNISWNTFLEQYVQDNEATFEIELSTTPLKLKLPSDVEQMRSKFQVVLQNFGEVNDTISPAVDVRGIKWRIHTNSQQNEMVAIFLQASNIDSNWLYRVKASISVLPFIANTPPFVYKFNHRYSQETPEGGLVMPWNEFMNPEKRFVRKGKMVLLVEMSVEEPKPLWKLERNIAINSNVDVDDDNSLPCCVCKKTHPNGDILAANCGELYCKSCYNVSVERSGYFWCKICNSRVQYVHPLYI